VADDNLPRLGGPLYLERDDFIPLSRQLHFFVHGKLFHQPVRLPQLRPHGGYQKPDLERGSSVRRVVRVTMVGQDLVGTSCDLRHRLVDIGQVVAPGRGQDQLARTIKKLNVEAFFERFDAVTNRARC
jgi:hypothetical protein